METDSPLDLRLEHTGSLSDIWHVFLPIAGSEGEHVMSAALLLWRHRKACRVFAACLEAEER